MVLKERKHWMDTVYRIGSAVIRIVQSRSFAASALAIVSAIIVAFVSFQVKAVTIVDGDTSKVVLTLDNDPIRVVAKAGVKLQEGDQIFAENDLSVVSVNRASEVKITADGITTIVRMSGGTVSDALEKVGVQLDSDDKINVSLEQEIDDKLDIKIDRISYQEYTETITEKFTSDIDYTTTLKYGRSLIKRAGVNGSKTVTYRKTIKNGEVIKTEVINEVVHKKMVPEIKLVGVKPGTPHSPPPYPIKLDSKGQPVSYKAKYTGRATAYSSDGGRAGTRTASGRKTEVGVVAVNPKLIPYGTELYIVSEDGSYVYGYAVAGDTGTALMSGHCLVDLVFEHLVECYRFGAKKLNVYVLK
jgi:uncharacterized protein YabE (DUF348 family)/3D (Asp-Asp-Asp) domain-containing protein